MRRVIIVGHQRGWKDVETVKWCREYAGGRTVPADRARGVNICDDLVKHGDLARAEMLLLASDKCEERDLCFLTTLSGTEPWKT